MRRKELVDYFNSLKIINDNSYSLMLNKISQEIEIDNSTKLKRDIINLLINNKNSYDEVTALDIFLVLKNKALFKEEDIKDIDEIICKIFNETELENIAYYIKGYITINKLDRYINRFSEFFIKDYYEEDIAKKIRDLIINDHPQKALGILNFTGAFRFEELMEKNEKINIFKVCEILRRNFKNDFDIKKLNDTIYDALNKCDNSVNIDRVLEFILGIYQDKKFINRGIVKKMCPLIGKTEEKFIESLFIEICEKCHVYRIEEFGNKSIKQAARGNTTQEDIKKLDFYLNKMIKTSKKIKKIKLDKSWDANEILRVLKIDTDKKVELFDIIHGLNIQYYEDNFSTNVMGYSFKMKKYNKAAIIINKNYMENKDRKRFTIAHEIGHICSENTDKDFSQDYIYQMTSVKKEENISNKFASELLIPSEYLLKWNEEKDIKINRIQNLAKEYEVSMEMACIRVVKASKGAYSFILMIDNLDEYTVSSEGYRYNQTKMDKIKVYLKDCNKDCIGKYYDEGHCKIDIMIRSKFKYILINHMYN